MSRSAAFAFGLASLLLAGCSGNELELHPVTGTVKYSDGSVPQGEMSTITFTPANPMEGKAASSNIEPDGSFKLYTVTQGDGGALAGEYRVTVNVIQGYPRGRSLVAGEYTDFNKTPLNATVDADKNHFDFTVKKP